jgi:hypothetical protein
MRAIAIKGTEDKPSAEFQIFFICELCGMHLVMLSKGHVAKPEEKEKVEALHGKLREDPEPGYG